MLVNGIIDAVLKQLVLRQDLLDSVNIILGYISACYSFQIKANPVFNLSYYDMFSRTHCKIFLIFPRFSFLGLLFLIALSFIFTLRNRSTFRPSFQQTCISLELSSCVQTRARAPPPHATSSSRPWRMWRLRCSDPELARRGPERVALCIINNWNSL